MRKKESERKRGREQLETSTDNTEIDLAILNANCHPSIFAVP